MGKNSVNVLGKKTTGTTEATKAKRSKTAAQQAKKAANMKAAAERLAKLQAQQQLVNKHRAAGLVGSDQTILQVVKEQEQAAAAAAAKQERIVEEQVARQFVDQVVSGPHGEMVSKSLSLKGPPCKVAKAVREFMRINCLRLPEAG